MGVTAPTRIARKLEMMRMPVSLRVVKLKRERHCALLPVGVFSDVLDGGGIFWFAASTFTVLGEQGLRACSAWFQDDSESRDCKRLAEREWSI